MSARFPAGPLDPVVHGIGRRVDLALHAVVDVPPGVESGRLQRALWCAARQDPALASHFHGHWFRSAWEVQTEPTWEVTEHTACNEAEAEAVLAARVATPLVFEKRLPVAVDVIHMPDRDRLVFRVSHLLADGGATKNVVYVVAAAYRRLVREPDWLPHAMPFHSRRPWRILQAIRWTALPRLIWAYVGEVWETLLSGYVSVPMGTGGRMRALDLRFTATQMNRVRERWRARGVTVNDILVTSAARAMVTCFATPKDRRVGFISTSDLRRLLPPEDLLCNLSNLRALDVGRLPLPPPEAHLMRVHEKTSAWKQNGRSLFASVLGASLASILPDILVRQVLWGLLTFLMHPGGLRSGFTNIGEMDASRMDFGTGPAMDGWIVPPCAHSPIFISGASGCAGNVHFTVPFWDEAWPEAGVRAFLAEVEREVVGLG